MKKQIKVILADRETPEFYPGCEIHISSHGVLCIKKGHRYVKAFKEGKWITAEEVNYV